jgi:hypothetical protein
LSVVVAEIAHIRIFVRAPQLSVDVRNVVTLEPRSCGMVGVSQPLTTCDCNSGFPLWRSGIFYFGRGMTGGKVITGCVQTRSRSRLLGGVPFARSAPSCGKSRSSPWSVSNLDSAARRCATHFVGLTRSNGSSFAPTRTLSPRNGPRLVGVPMRLVAATPTRFAGRHKVAALMPGCRLSSDLIRGWYSRSGGDVFRARRPRLSPVLQGGAFPFRCLSQAATQGG